MTLFNKLGVGKSLTLLKRRAIKTDAGKMLTISIKNNEFTMMVDSGSSSMSISTKECIGGDEDFDNITVNLVDFENFIKSSEGEIKLEKNIDNLLIYDDEVSETMVHMENDYFYSYTGEDNHLKLSFSQEDSVYLMEALQSVDKNNPKFELNGVLLEVNENIVNIVSTDTRRLYLGENEYIGIQNGSEEYVSYILPRGDLEAILDTVKGSKEMYTISLDSENNLFFFESGTTVISGKLIGGKFPEYRRIVPNGFKFQFDFDKKEIEKKLKRIMKKAQDITITINPDSSAKFDGLLNSNTNTISASMPTRAYPEVEESITFALNIKFILDAIKFGDEDMSIKFNDKNIPFSVTHREQSQTIIMPIIL